MVSVLEIHVVEGWAVGCGGGSLCAFQSSSIVLLEFVIGIIHLTVELTRENIIDTLGIPPYCSFGQLAQLSCRCHGIEYPLRAELLMENIGEACACWLLISNKLSPESVSPSLNVCV